DSVLKLYESYPGESDLQEYLKCALREGLLSLDIYLETFLAAAQSQDFRTAATLDSLCRIALDAHYTSGLPPMGTVISYSKSPILFLETVMNALSLLTVSYSLQVSHYHQVSDSASDLVCLLLECTDSLDLSQVSIPQARMYLRDISALVNEYDLRADVKQAVDAFGFQMHLLTTDNEKARLEVQLMHTMHLAAGKGEILGQNFNSNTAVCSLLLEGLLLRRGADQYGAGSGADPVGLLVAIYRWTSWTPDVFYTQILCSAFMSMSQAASLSMALLWRAFTIGRLPLVLLHFQIRPYAFQNLFARRSSVSSRFIHYCKFWILRSYSTSVINELLKQLLALGLIGQASATTVNTDTNLSRIASEARESGQDLETYIDGKISSEMNDEDSKNWIARLFSDATCHHTLAQCLRFMSLTNALDVDAFGNLCRLLCLSDVLLDILSLHVKISSLVRAALVFLEDYDCETVGDPQSAFTHLGDIMLFIQSVVVRFHVRVTMSADFLRYTHIPRRVEDIPAPDLASYNAWYKALFDSNSDGIEDNLLRTTNPKILLGLAVTLFSHAIEAASSHDSKVDIEVLKNGVSYFNGPLLNWTLVGVVRGLLEDVHRRSLNAPLHLEILQSLVSESCPRPVLRLCGPAILATLHALAKEGRASAAFNTSFEALYSKVIGVSPDQAKVTASSPRTPWSTQRAIQTAMHQASTGKPAMLDVSKCLHAQPPIPFLKLLWTQLVTSTNTGDVDGARQVVVLTLAVPRTGALPLLPIFIHTVFPALIPSLEAQIVSQSELMMKVELLVTIMSMSLELTLHVEKAFQNLTVGDRHVVNGQSSMALARALSTFLRARKSSQICMTMLQRLSSSQRFVANFPVFVNDL
ncbi:hypothetical protein FISHEDRAFT_38902, partial [Fistulina hepatica ATCC 64428]